MSSTTSPARNTACCMARRSARGEADSTGSSISNGNEGQSGVVDIDSRTGEGDFTGIRMQFSGATRDLPGGPKESISQRSKLWPSSRRLSAPMRRRRKNSRRWYESVSSRRSIRRRASASPTPAYTTKASRFSAAYGFGYTARFGITAWPKPRSMCGQQRSALGPTRPVSSKPRQPTCRNTTQSCW